VQYQGNVFSSTHDTPEAAEEAKQDILRRIRAGAVTQTSGKGAALCRIRPLRSWPKHGGVYFCAIPGLARVKIGCAVNISRRLNELRYQVPELVLLAHAPGGRSDEQALHQQFAPLRVAGEWFRLEGDLLAHIRELRKK